MDEVGNADVVAVGTTGVVDAEVNVVVFVVVLADVEDEEVVGGLCEVDSPGLGLSPQSTLSA